ncbi:glycosyltransferase [Arthrobacter sp. NPDC080073]|uniref:glycosyltransferase n=1 Tax=Arthrobacter sp. NPDC080073 TaxID=3155919 RepID=UPI00341295B6
MKISMISEHASPLAAIGGVDAGGQNVHVAELAKALAVRGHDVTVYTRKDNRALPARVTLSEGYEVVNVAAGPPEPVPKDELLPFMPALAEGIAADWRGGAPEVAHSHFWMSGVACIEATQQLGSDTEESPHMAQTFHALGSVKRRHQGPQDTSPKEREWMEPWVGQSVDRVVATCTDEVFELKRLGVDRTRISIVPCGVDTAMFTPHGPAEPRPEGYRILTVGRLVPRKGVDTVIQSLSGLALRGIRNAELWVVGGGAGADALDEDPEVRRLRNLASDVGVSTQVKFTGQVPRERMPAVLRSADVVVCAPWYEPFGIVPLEAMGCGIPVIATAVGGLSDTVTHGVTGLQIPPKDPDALAEALAELLSQPDMARSMGRAGVTRVRDRYTWSRVAADTERVYESMLGGASRRRVVRLDGSGFGRSGA